MGDHARLWHACLINDNPRAWFHAWFQVRNQSFEDQGTILVGPVVEYPAEKVHVRLNGLRLKYVVNHILEPVLKVNRDIVGGFLDHLLHILNDDRGVGKASSQLHADVADTTSNIDELDLAQRFPVVVVDKVRRIVFLHHHIRLHGVPETLSSSRVPFKDLV